MRATGGNYQKAFSEVYKKYGSDSRIVAGVFGSNVKEAEGFAKASRTRVFWLLGSPLPASVLECCAAAGRGQSPATGRIFRLVNPSIASYATVLDFYARLPPRRKSAGRNSSGRRAPTSAPPRQWCGALNSPSSASNSADNAHRRSDRPCQRGECREAGRYRPSSVSHATAGDVRPRCARQPRGPSRCGSPRRRTMVQQARSAALGTFRLENRTGQQALAVPSTKAKFVKVRLPSTFAEKKGFALGKGGGQFRQRRLACAFLDLNLAQGETLLLRERGQQADLDELRLRGRSRRLARRPVRFSRRKVPSVAERACWTIVSGEDFHILKGRVVVEHNAVERRRLFLEKRDGRYLPASRHSPTWHGRSDRR